MRRRSVAFLHSALCLLQFGGCVDSTGETRRTPTTPSLLTSDVNYAGEWAGGWREVTCRELPPRAGYCANRLRDRDFSYVRLYLSQTGPRVSGRIQTRLGTGPVAGVVEGPWGRLRLGGEVTYYDSPTLAMRLRRTRLIADAGGSLVGGLELEYTWDAQTPAAIVIAEMWPSQVNRCPGPRFTGFFWEC